MLNIHRRGGYSFLSKGVQQMMSKICLGCSLLVACFALTGCDVDVKDDGELPKVDVDPGRAPDVDIHGPDVNVGTEEKTITVPDIDVDVPEEEENEPNRVPDADDDR
jgi:hypothetical protein